MIKLVGEDTVAETQKYRAETCSKCAAAQVNSIESYVTTKSLDRSEG